jgi:hypothetical protein
MLLFGAQFRTLRESSCKIGRHNVAVCLSDGAMSLELRARLKCPNDGCAVQPSKLAPYFDCLRERVAASRELSAIRLNWEIRERRGLPPTIGGETVRGDEPSADTATTNGRRPAAARRRLTFLALSSCSDEPRTLRATRMFSFAR